MKQQLFVLPSVVQAALLLFCIYGLYGCSLIGFGIGAVLDGGKPDKDTLQVGDGMHLKRGYKVRIFLVDSTVVEGTYKKSALFDSATYALRHARFLESVKEDVTFPKLGDTLFLQPRTSKLQSPYLFCGYGMGYLKLQLLDKSRHTKALFTQLTTIGNRDRKMLDLGMLERMNKAGQLPSDLYLVVSTNQGTTHVPTDDILYIEKRNAKNAKWKGAAIGLVVDAAVIVVGVISMRNAARDGISW